MDKRDIVNRFLKEGILLSPEDLGKINEENYQQILESRKGSPKTEEVPTLANEREEEKIMLLLFRLYWW